MKEHIRGWNAQTLYALEYEHDGLKWALNFYAVDGNDAQKKVKSIKQSLKLLGPSAGFIPAGEGMGEVSGPSGIPSHPPAF